MAQNEQQETDDFSNEDFSYAESYYVTIEGVGRRIEITDEEGNTNTPVGDGSVELSVPDVSRDGGAPRFADPETTHGLNFGAYEGSVITIRFRVGAEPINIDLVRGVSNHSPTLAVRYRDVRLPEGVNAQLKFVASTVEDLRYDADGDGVFETAVQPTVSLTGAAALDISAPFVTITAEAQGATQRVTISAIDAGSGVKTIFYSLDSTSYQPYTAPLSLDATQTHTVYAYADDNAANRSAPIAATIKPTVTLTPVADAYTSGGARDSNYGADPFIFAKRHPDSFFGRHSYLKFDTSSFAGSLSNARLRLYGKLVNTATPIDVRVFSSSVTTWTEGTGTTAAPVTAVMPTEVMTWNSKPAATQANASPLGSLLVNSGADQRYEYDLTAFIQAERAAGRNVVTLLIRTPTITQPGQAQFNSREAAENRPQLVIER